VNELHERVLAVITTLDTPYEIHDHSAFDQSIQNPADFAAALGYPLQRITKTLFLRTHDGQSFAAAVCSTDRRLNFKSMARAIGAKRLETASSEDLSAQTDYPRNGVSPLGLRDDIAVVVDRDLFDYPTVLIGGGAAGIEIELPPADLVRLSKATTESITV
jgi:Cys-tRNA(Pro)/Cys-tRNA(Cys) deacylase